jgi:DHA2 family multidrug resistance protein
MTHLNTEISFWDAAAARMWQAIGIPFLFIPITNVAYVGLKPEENNQASALMNVTRNLGGTIGISTVQTLLAQRQQFHQSRMVETLDPLNPNYTQGLAQITDALKSQGTSPSDSNIAAISQLYRSLVQQTMMLSYIEAFHLMMIIVLCAMPLVLLMRGPANGRTKTEGAAL